MEDTVNRVINRAPNEPRMFESEKWKTIHIAVTIIVSESMARGTLAIQMTIIALRCVALRWSSSVKK